MEADSLKWVGSSCGLHGPYIFYKAFKFDRDGKTRILSLGDFFLVRCTPEDPICVAELQLLWEERTTKQLLSSSKLYFLPEDTPAGRTVNHGEDEVVGVTEKVIVRLGDLVKWTAGDQSAWARGRRALPSVTAVPKTAVLRELGTNGHREPRQGAGGHRPTHTHTHTHTHTSSRFRISFRDVLREKAQIGEDAEERARVLVLSYPQYCRYRGVLARLRGAAEVAVVTERVVRALGGISHLHGDVRVLYCRETFQHPTLTHNQSVCEHFAPNLKGRPRKRKLSQRREDQNQNQNPNQRPQNVPHTRHPARTPPEPRPPPKVRTECRVMVRKVRNGGMSKGLPPEEKEERRRERQSDQQEEREERRRECRSDQQVDGAGRNVQRAEQVFLSALHRYMKKRHTPIERIPYLGFKQINLWTMFETAQKLGGYEQITAHRQWKQVYDELGGHPGSTSAATCTRRHYERLLLPYERYSQAQEEGSGVELRPIKAEPVAITGSKDKGSSPTSGHPNAEVALKQEPQSDTQPQSSAGSDDSEGVQYSVLLKDVSININTKAEEEEEEEEEEELQVTMKQEETLSAQLNHHDNHQPANHILTDLSLQTNRKRPSPSLADPSGRPCRQDEDPSGGSLSKGDAPSPEAHRQASSPGHRSLLPLGVPEPRVAGRIPEGESEPVGPVKVAEAEGSPLGVLEGSPPLGALQGSPPNAHSAPYFSGPHSGMSPLAKKKLLSQVCAGGGGLPQNYPTAPPAGGGGVLSQVCAGGTTPQNYPTAPPTAARSDVAWATGGSCSGGVVSCSLDPVSQQGAPPPAHPPSPDAAPPASRPPPSPDAAPPASRPSVIQHAQSLRPPAPEWSSVSEQAVRGPEAPERVKRTWEETMAPHGCGYGTQVFYSSPHLHSLFRHTGHRLGHQPQRPQQHLGAHAHAQVQVCASRVAGVTRNIPDVVIDERYSTPPPPALLGRHKPGDLASPRKMPPPPPAKGPFEGRTCPTMHGDCRVPAPTQLGLDAHDGIACNRFPVPARDASLAYKVSVPARDASLAYKAGVPVGVSGAGGLKQPGGLWRTSEAVRAVQRRLEDPEGSAPPAKTRALSPSPRHPARECSGEGAEPPEPARAVHLNSCSSSSPGRRYPQHARHLGGLCPAGTFGAQEACEGPRALGYPPYPPPHHRLAFLKNRGGTVSASGVAPPLVLHALMMQGQLVRSPAQTLARQAPSAHAAVPPGMYPLCPPNPPHTYPALQLPAVQPNTTL
ncbi:AT-rich interactive domain-containing protein 5B-like [Sardina pilchardus]|uniref:AT-rich interactive domain-containing protein 5B-like n=1 Tax=Sardina pilchardus TaxID=27697 RepID=UPI002E127923